MTCLCDPDAVPDIPGCTVTEARPSVRNVLAELLDPASASSSSSSSSSPLGSTEELPKTGKVGTQEDLEKGVVDGKSAGPAQGGVAVFAAGPGTLLREAGNAVALANMSARGQGAGGVAFCAEAFTV